MQQWEHMSRSVDAGSYGEGGRVCWKDGKELPDYRSEPPSEEALRLAGAQGWELVSVYVPTNTVQAEVYPVYVFKRPKE